MTSLTAQAKLEQTAKRRGSVSSPMTRVSDDGIHRKKREIHRLGDSGPDKLGCFHWKKVTTWGFVLCRYYCKAGKPAN